VLAKWSLAEHASENPDPYFEQFAQSVDPHERTGWSVAGTREDAMGSIHSYRAWNAWCVSVTFAGLTRSHIPAGWLLILRKGSLHRDISIGNVLMLDPPVKTKPFAEVAPEQRMQQLRLREGSELANHVNLVEEMIQKLGSPNMCCGSVIDGDMAARLEGYFTPRGLGEKSGYA